MDAEPEGLAISIMLRASKTVRFVINVKSGPPHADRRNFYEVEKGSRMR
jgi:hypothetical protein